MNNIFKWADRTHIITEEILLKDLNECVSGGDAPVMIVGDYLYYSQINNQYYAIRHDSISDEPYIVCNVSNQECELLEECEFIKRVN